MKLKKNNKIQEYVKQTAFFLKFNKAFFKPQKNKEKNMKKIK